MKRWIFLPMALLAGAALAQVAGSGVYTDEINGFSLSPPAGTERVRETNPRRLVAWQKRDDKTQAVVWTLDVLKLRTDASATSQPFATRAEVAAQQLRQDRFMTEDPILGTTAGLPSADYRGEWKGVVSLWRRQTWIQSGPTEYLILDISGPMDLKDEMDRTLTLVNSSLRIFDPQAAQAQRRATLQRGGELLEHVKLETIKPVLSPQPYYFSLTLDNRTIGAIKITESIAQRSGATGLLILRSGVIRMPGQPRRLSREELFATPDRVSESWKREYIEGEGPTANRFTIEAVKQEEMIVVTTSDERQPVRQKKIPQTLLGPYLPQAFDLILPRLLDRQIKQAYGFAMYSGAANDFDLRTMTVIGPANMQTSAGATPVVHLTDQATADSAPANVWVDASGNTVQARTAEGLVLLRVTAAEANGLFPADMAELGALESKAPAAPAPAAPDKATPDKKDKKAK